MKYWTRKTGSQRTSRAYPALIEPNFAGQGGHDHLIFRANSQWHYLQPESREEVTELLRQAHCILEQWKEPTP